MAGEGTAASFGAKCDRLLRLQSDEVLGPLVPPVAPIAPQPGWWPDLAAPAETEIARYAAALMRERPTLADEVEATCGPAPWIVRSSGDEDSEENVNAGGYDSLICASKHDLADCVARVALSGLGIEVRRQQALVASDAAVRAIPCFVQPLLPVAVEGSVATGEAPFLDDHVVDRIERLARRALALFGWEAVDNEWGVETDAGFVSVTTLLAADPAEAVDQHAFGFGFGTAQTADDRPTSAALTLADAGLRLWRGDSLRQVELRRLWLLQARPARMEHAYRDVALLTGPAQADLARHFDHAAAAVMIAGERSAGGFLAAPTLAGAWRDYLALDAAGRASVALVMVAGGSAAEHAGIMFRQERITCALVDTAKVPHGVSQAVLDRGRAYFGDAAMVARAVTEYRRQLALPADARLVYAGELPAPPPPELAILARLPLDPASHDEIIARSLDPARGGWLARGDLYASPSYWGQALARGKFQPPSGIAGDYRAALALARNPASGARQLASLWRLAGSAVVQLAASPDLRLALSLIALERATDWAHELTIGRIITAAATALDHEGSAAALALLDMVEAIGRETALLPIYEDDERAALLDALAEAILSAADTAQPALMALVGLDLPVPALVRLVAAAASDPSLRDTAVAIHQAEAAFRGAAFAPEAPLLADAINRAFAVYVAGAARASALEDVIALVRGKLIEAYDATLKAMLVSLVDAREQAVYKRYLDVMGRWIAFARIGEVDEVSGAALAQYEEWLSEWHRGEVPTDFAIEDRNWRVEFRLAAAGESKEPYENPHALHNLLHQWMLANNVLGTGLLPRRLRALHRFCMTFSSRATKVLRFESALFEIEIPMGTHKASFTFTPAAMSAEWAEPPDCPGDEIARVLAFEAVIDRLRAWRFPTLTDRRQVVISTWTLFIRLNADPDRGWTFAALFEAVVALRYLFDSSYDFSYRSNDDAADLADSLCSAGWREVFAALTTYRAAYDDYGQYVPLHTLPMANATATLAEDRVARGAARRQQRVGFAATIALIDALAAWLCTEGDGDRWDRRYELLRFSALLVAAVWPGQALALLHERREYHAGDDLLASALLRRADLTGQIEALLAQGDGDPLAGFSGLVIRHCPALAADRAATLAPQLVAARGGWKRAKQYLVAHCAGALDDAALANIVADLDTVPFAVDAAAEARIDAAIAAVGASPLRLVLAHGVDWTMLDA